MNRPEIEYIKTETLHFDPKNPRLVEFERSTSEREILKLLWETMDIEELVPSIVASGFLPQEPLIVEKEAGTNIVIEGNRRLAAVKVLLDPSIAKENGWLVTPPTPQAKKALEELPCIVTTRKDSWRYLGFKHVNGPVKWSSYAKAAYIAQVREEYNIPLAQIANQIGDKHNTVQRLYHGLMVLKQAEKAKVYTVEDRYSQRLAFSHLYTGLGYEGIASFLGISPKESEVSEPVPKEKLTELGELCIWLYGSKQQKLPPIVRSQNPDLRELNAVLTKRESLAAIRAGVSLEKSYELSQAPSGVFERALLAAKRELGTAKTYITDGYDDTEEVLRIAGTVAQLAEDIYGEMERKRSSKQPKQRLTEKKSDV